MPEDACPEVSESLFSEIEEKKLEVQRLLERRSILENEMDNIVERGGEEHLKKVEEYNALAEQYNDLVSVLDGLIDEYNKQIKERENCINE
jgi:predicted nuclease with TOPRIM domain